MYVKCYDTLPQAARKIRTEVFVEEQGFEKEFDETDHCSKHLVLYDEQTAIATCRFFRHESGENYIIGRIAVIKRYRGQNIGSHILALAEDKIKELDGKQVFLHAQERAKGFYEKQGYCSYGEKDLDEDCPHIWMYKELGEK